MTERRIEWLYLMIGLVIGTAWFVFNRSIDFGPYPPLADAVTYSQISQSFKNLGEAFTYAGDRTFGFPFILYLMKSGTEAFQTAMLLLFHFVSSFFFYRALGKASQFYGLRLHPSALLLILIHPGLISHTSVLLTDTFTADLIMISAALFLGARDAEKQALLLRGAATGLVLGLAIGVRPFLAVSVASMFGLGMIMAMISRPRERLLLFLGPMLCAASLVLAPAILSCRANFGKVCIQNPSFAGPAAAGSLQMGLTSIRTYWSSRSPNTVLPEDWSMVENFKSSCEINQVTGPSQWLECVFSKPFFIPIYLSKKIVALFDSFFLQPYASDVTPSWVRHYSRPYGALSFVGFFCAIGILCVFLKRRMIWESLALSLPILTLLFQLPMHIEPRYSFSVVPVCFASAIWLLQKALQQGRRTTVMYLLLAATLGGTFLTQTHYWDLDDLILQQIEGWDQ